MRLPAEKLARIQSQIRDWSQRRVCCKQQLESLIGLLQHACRVVRPGRSFLRRMISLLSHSHRPYHHIRLTKHFRADLCWWQTFLPAWNGVFVLPPQPDLSVCFASDASGRWWCGARWDAMWFQFKWPQSALIHHITFLELVAVLMACVVWGPMCRGHTVLCWCDNQAAVCAIAARSCRDAKLMHLLRCLFSLKPVANLSWWQDIFQGFIMSLRMTYPVIGLRHFSQRSPKRPKNRHQSLRNSLKYYWIQASIGHHPVGHSGSILLWERTRRLYPEDIPSSTQPLLPVLYHVRCYPFPVSESLLCYFMASLARQGLTPATIRTYLAGVRHAQIMRGFEEPRQHSTLPRLHLLQAGVKRVRCQQGTHQARQRLPILPNYLRQIRAIWGASPDPDARMLWAAVTLTFFGVF